jgi:hypothetical protein
MNVRVMFALGCLKFKSYAAGCEFLESCKLTATLVVGPALQTEWTPDIKEEEEVDVKTLEPGQDRSLPYGVQSIHTRTAMKKNCPRRKAVSGK